MSSAEHLANSLRTTSQALARQLRAHCDTETLTQLQQGVLARLDLGATPSSAELARLEHVSPQAMSTTVTSLVRDGLVAVSPDPADGRRRILSLTPEGAEAIHEVRDTKNRWLTDRIDTELSDAERRTLADALALIDRVIER